MVCLIIHVMVIFVHHWLMCGNSRFTFHQQCSWCHVLWTFQGHWLNYAMSSSIPRTFFWTRCFSSTLSLLWCPVPWCFISGKIRIEDIEVLHMSFKVSLFFDVFVVISLAISSLSILPQHDEAFRQRYDIMIWYCTMNIFLPTQQHCCTLAGIMTSWILHSQYPLQ